MKYELVTIKLFWNFPAPPVKPTPAPNLLDDLMGGDTTHNNQMNGNDGMLSVLPLYVKLERDAISVWSKSLKMQILMWLVILFVIFICLDYAGPYKLTAFDKNGLKVELTCERDNGQPNVTIINVKSTNSTATTMSDYIFQAAVPKVTKSTQSSGLQSSSFSFSKFFMLDYPWP